MPRRRQKNNVLFRSFGISLLVVFAMVVVAAQFGAFKAIQRQFGAANVVLVAPAEAPREKEKPAPKKEKHQEVRKAPGAKGKSPRSSHSRIASPTVVTASSSGGGGGADAPVVDPGSGLKPGEIPTDTKPKTTTSTPPETTTQPIVKTPPQPVETKTETKPETKPEIKPTPTPAKFIDAEPTAQPQPTIPDDLLSQDLSVDYIAEAHVGADGVPTDVKTIQSTGIEELDRLALESARKWRFSPATLGGVATDQTVHIKIQFRVQ